MNSDTKILKELLTLPTDPFHEEYVADYIVNFLKRSRVPFRMDKFGNILARYKKGKSAQPVVLSAHMDHPGFEVLRCVKGGCLVGILGGVNLEYFSEASVLIKTKKEIVKGVVDKKPLAEKWHDKPIFKIKVKGKVLPEKRDFGWYSLPGFELKRGIVYTKAADNVVSCASLIVLLKALLKKKVNVDVRCLFTRAEEIGFGGCIAIAGENIISERVPIIVLECSSAAAGKVEIGGGPVLRVGDKLSCFSSKIDCWMKDIAESVAKKNRKFKYQRALLSGGTCEASVWTLKGRDVGGLAFPLGNYHNNGPKNYGPEYISLYDFLMMKEWLLGIATGGKPSRPLNAVRSKLSDNYKKWRQEFAKNNYFKSGR